MSLDEAYARLAIKVDFVPASSSNRPGTKIQPTHLTIHNTDNVSPDADALMHALYIKGEDARKRRVSWHFTVDDRRCVQHLPTNEMGWHAGKGNPVSVAVEVCQNAGIDQDAAIDRAALLAAVLMRQLHIPKERVVTHNSWTGKDCPSVILHKFVGGFTAFVDLAESYRGSLVALDASAVRALDGASLSDSDEPAQIVTAIEDDTDVKRMASRVSLLERLLGQREARIAEMEEELLELRSLLLEGP